MDKEKEKQEISLIGRIFSLEAVLILMGILSIIAGAIYREMDKVFWGAVILCAAVILNLVRKKGGRGKGMGDAGK